MITTPTPKTDVTIKQWMDEGCKSAISFVALSRHLERELVSRIQQVAELTADGRHWRNIAEGWERAADAAQQPAEFYKDYSESTMRAMQALKARAEDERDRLRADNAELVKALEPFAKFACDEQNNCFNCIARAALAKVSQ